MIAFVPKELLVENLRKDAFRLDVRNLVMNKWRNFYFLSDTLPEASPFLLSSILSKLIFNANLCLIDWLDESLSD